MGFVRRAWCRGLTPLERSIPSETVRTEFASTFTVLENERTVVSANEKGDEEQPKIGLGIAVGVGLGAAIGVVVDNIALWTGIGVSLGVTLGVVWSNTES